MSKYALIMSFVEFECNKLGDIYPSSTECVWVDGPLFGSDPYNYLVFESNCYPISLSGGCYVRFPLLAFTRAV